MSFLINRQLCNCPRTFRRSTLQLLRFSSQTIEESGDKHDAENDVTTIKQTQSFKEMLDESALIQFGRPNGKCVIGKITAVCNDDLYVDFGAKFEAVVKIPINKPQYYEQGALVRLILNKFEMTGAFLGDPRHITLCEADAILIGPYAPLSSG